MITAHEARELSGPTVKQHLEILNKYIEDSAKQGNQFVIIRKEPYNLWMYSDKDFRGVAKDTVVHVQCLGYKVSQYYQDGNNFVDCGLKISWEK